MNLTPAVAIRAERDFHKPMKTLLTAALLGTLAFPAFAIEGTVRPIIDPMRDLQMRQMVPTCPPNVPITVSGTRFVCGFNIAKPKLVVREMNTIVVSCDPRHDGDGCNTVTGGADIESVTTRKYLIKGEWDGCSALRLDGGTRSVVGGFSSSASFVYNGILAVTEDDSMPKRWWVHHGNELSKAICYRYE